MAVLADIPLVLTGDALTITTPEGVEVQITVPEGVVPGEEFTVNLGSADTEDAEEDAPAAAEDAEEDAAAEAEDAEDVASVAADSESGGGAEVEGQSDDENDDAEKQAMAAVADEAHEQVEAARLAKEARSALRACPAPCSSRTRARALGCLGRSCRS